MAQVDLKILLSAIDKATPALVSVQDSLRAGGEAAKKFGQQWGESLEMAKRAGTGMVVAGTAIVGAFAAAGTEGAKFQQNMRNVNSIVKGGEEGFAAMSKQVKQIAWDPKITDGATELAAGLYDIQSSGIAASESMKTLEIASKGAAAGQSEAATASRVLTATMNAYNQKTGADAARIMDILFKTVDRGVVTFDELAASLSNATGVAGNAGVPLEQVAAAMATITKQGFSAAESSTAIGRAITTLLNPNKELAAALKATGYASGYALLKEQGLAGAMKWLTQATGGSIDKMVELMGEMRAARAAMSLAGSGAQTFAEDLAAMQDATGAMGVALDEQSKGPMFQWKVGLKEAKLLAIEFGGVFLAAVRPLVPVLHAVTGAIRTIIENPLGKWAAAATLALGAFLVMAGGGIVVVAKLATSIIALKGAMTAFAATTTAMKLAGGLWTAAETLTAVFGSVGSIAAGVGGTIASAFSAVVGFLAPVGAAIAAIGAAIAALPLGLILGIAAAIAAIGVAVWQLIKHRAAVGAFFRDMGRAIGRDMRNAWQAMGTFFSDLPRNLGRWLGSAARAVTYGLGYMVGVFQRLPRRVWEIIKDVGRAIRALPGQIAAGLSKALTAIGDWTKAAWRRFSDWAKDLPGLIKRAMVDFYDAIASGMMRALKAVGLFFVSIYEWLKALPGRMWDYAKAAAQAFADGFKSALGSGAFAEGQQAGGEAIAGKRAGGGSVSAGKAYLVGERGAEVFIPSVKGSIIPDITRAIGSLGFGGGGSGSGRDVQRNTRATEKLTEKLEDLRDPIQLLKLSLRRMSDVQLAAIQAQQSMMSDAQVEAWDLEMDRRGWQTKHDDEVTAERRQIAQTGPQPGQFSQPGGVMANSFAAIIRGIQAVPVIRRLRSESPAIQQAQRMATPSDPARILRDALLQASVAGPAGLGPGVVPWTRVHLNMQPGLAATITRGGANMALRVQQDRAMKQVDSAY